MKIIEVFQPVESFLDGARAMEVFYDNEKEARKQCNGLGASPEPIKRLGLQMPTGEIYLFVSSTPIKVFRTTDEMKKEQALAKLTPEERKLLGHG